MCVASVASLKEGEREPEWLASLRAARPRSHLSWPRPGASIPASPGSNERIVGFSRICGATLGLEDCVALSGLTEEQVLAIAEHEHLPEIAATALAQYLSKEEHGMEKIRDMIVDDIRQAQQRQDKAHILTLLHVLHHFLKSHPEVCPSQHPWSELDFRSGRR
jgi:hypothetical protein